MNRLRYFNIWDMGKGLVIKYQDHRFIALPVLYLLGFTLIATWFSATAGIITAFVLLTFLALSVSFETRRAVEQDIIESQKQIHALMMLNDICKFREPIPFLTGWAATPDLLLSIYKTIRDQKTKTILELGSGASTIVIPYFQKEKGSRLISIEHDAGFMEKTRADVEVHKHKTVELKYCPIADIPLNGETWKWYDLSTVNIPKDVDMLIVDGPPFKLQRFARYPALPVLYPYLANRAVIIMDDADRVDEQEIIARWKNEFPNIRVEMDRSLKGLARIYVTK